MHLHLSTALRAADPGGATHELALPDALLLAWLALEGPTPRLRLAALLWPDKDADAARNSLRQRLFKLRKALDADLVQGQATLALAEGVTHDLHEADELLGGADPGLQGEMALWLGQQRQRRRQRVVQSLVELSVLAEQGREWADAIGHAEEALALEPLSEEAHRRLMRLHYLAGNRAAALLAFDACERMLKDEVGARPSPETLALLKTIDGAEAAGEPRAVALAPSLPALQRPPRLIGREAAWQALEQAWAAQQLVVVTGEAGMGKSRLLGDFAASRRGVLVLQARPGDERVVFGTLSRLLRLLPQPALAALPEALRGELARLLPGLATTAPGETERTRLFNAVAAALESPGLGLEGFVVDDLHFADEASVEVLRFAAEGSRRRWLLASRPAEGTAAARGLVAAPEALQLPLQPLTLQQVAELVQSLDLPGWDAERVAPELLRRTGGNPLFLLETVKSMLGGAVAASGGVRLPITALIERRIGQLSVAAVKLARCAAVAVPDFSIELASHVLGLRTLDLADPWAELEAAQVFRDGAFAHDLIRDSALASVPAPVARQLHAEIAAYLAAHGGAPARVAEHWIAAGREAQALPALTEAARLAQSALRRKEEAALREQIATIAERLGRHDVAYEALLALNDALHVADRTAIDERLFERLERAASTPAQRVHVAVVRAEAAASLGRYDEAIARGEAAAAQARAAALPEDEAQALRFAAASASHAGQSARAVRLLRSAMPWVLQHGSAELQQNFFNDFACCLDNADQPHEALGWHQRALELALKLPRLDAAVMVCGNLVACHKSAGRVEAALAMLQQGRRYALAFDQAEASTWNFDMMALALLRDLARYPEALAMADAALRGTAQHPGALPVAQLHQAMLWLHLGQTARAGQVLDAIEAAGVPPMRRARLSHVQGRLLFMRGQDGSAKWREAVAAAPATGRAAISALIALDHATLLPPAEGLAACEAEITRAEGFGYDGIALAARIRASALALAAGDAVLAAAHARQALAAPQGPQGVVTDDLFPAERWVNAAKALHALGDEPAAQRALRDGLAWLQATARQVPTEFRAGFLERVPLNRELQALAVRIGA